MIGLKLQKLSEELKLINTPSFKIVLLMDHLYAILTEIENRIQVLESKHEHNFGTNSKGVG